jgi:hypothetical protein
MTGTLTYARTELARVQILWTEATLNPTSTSYSRDLIRSAFTCQAFRWTAYYALGPDGRCYASLRVDLDEEVHREQLRIDPLVKTSAAWVDRVAPDLRMLVEQFESLVDRFGFQVVARLCARRVAMPPAAEARPAPAIIWANGTNRGFPRKIKGLQELVAQYVLSDALVEPAT